MEWIVRFMVWLSRWTQLLSRCGIVGYEEYQPGEKLKVLLVGYNGARNTPPLMPSRQSLCGRCKSITTITWTPSYPHHHGTCKANIQADYSIRILTRDKSVRIKC